MTQIGPNVFSAQIQQQATQQAPKRFAGATRDGSSPTDEFRGRRRTNSREGASSASASRDSFFPQSMPVVMRKALEHVDRILHS